MATEGCGTMNVCVMPSLRCGKTPGLGSLDLIHFTLFHTAPDQLMPVGTVAVAATKPIATAQPDIITCEILFWNQSRKKNLKNMSPSASIKGNLDKKIWLTNGSIVEHRITLNITTPQQYTTSTSRYFTNALPPKLQRLRRKRCSLFSLVPKGSHKFQLHMLFMSVYEAKWQMQLSYRFVRVILAHVSGLHNFPQMTIPVKKKFYICSNVSHNCSEQSLRILMWNATDVQKHQH